MRCGQGRADKDLRTYSNERQDPCTVHIDSCNSLSRKQTIAIRGRRVTTTTTYYYYYVLLQRVYHCLTRRLSIVHVGLSSVLVANDLFYVE